MIEKVSTLLGAVAVAVLLAGGVSAAVAEQPSAPDRATVQVPATQTLEFEGTSDAEAPVPVQQLPDPTTTTTAPKVTRGGTAVSFTIVPR